MFIEKELVIVSAKMDSLDVQPRGQSCDPVNVEAHMFVLKFATAGFMYRICGRCGTVRISEPQVTNETIYAMLERAFWASVQIVDDGSESDADGEGK